MLHMTRSPRRRTRAAVAATATATALTLGLAACSDDDSDADSTPSATSTSSQGADGSSDPSQGSTDDKGTWPRSVDSLVVRDGKATPQTEKVEIPARPERIVSTSVTLTGTLLAVDAPVIASGGAKVGPTSDDKGFFKQWAQKADEKGVESLWQLEPDTERVARADPDLILVSARGADVATAQYEELKKIGVPVIVVDYANQQWTDLTAEIGEITGHEAEAAEATKTYKDRVEEVKSSIDTPEQPVNVVLPATDGGLNYMTGESAQGRIINDLGWELSVPGDGVARSDGDYAGREDVRQVTAENGDKGLVGRTVLGINVDGTTPVVDKLKENPLLAGTYAVKNNRVFELGPSAFRVDYFSAMEILDEIEKFFAAK